MTTTGAVALIVYATIGIVAAFFTGGYAAWDSAGHTRTYLDSSDIGWGLLVAGLTVVAWPISVPWCVIHHIMEAQKQPLFWKPPAARERVNAERAARKERERKRIEQEVGLDDD